MHGDFIGAGWAVMIAGKGAKKELKLTLVVEAQLLADAIRLDMIQMWRSDHVMGSLLHSPLPSC